MPSRSRAAAAGKGRSAAAQADLTRWQAGPASRFDALLKASEVTDAEMGRLLALAPSNINRWRSGARVPNLDQLTRILSKVDGSLDYVMGLRPGIDPTHARALIDVAEQIVKAARRQEGQADKR
jgi:DNA-binding transcriptional regulator YdaS (Cro superfamily)